MRTSERIAILFSGMAIIIVFLTILYLELDSKKSPGETSGEPIIINTTIPAVQAEELSANVESRSNADEVDITLLAQCMQSEAGVDWSDEDIMCIGEVVLNRVASPYFPDTVMEVLYQEGQYQPFIEGTIPDQPDEHYIQLAERLLDGERVLDDPDVIWQALFVQGSEIVRTVYDEVLDTTTYFCKG